MNVGLVLMLTFATTLLVATLISARAQRTVLSSAVLFLVVGMALGRGTLGVLDIGATDHVVGELAQLALVSILFVDGMKVGVEDLRTAWRLPGRALLLGLPLTLLATAALAHLLTGVPWPEALLLGAALSPTDPVFAAAIVGRDQIPLRLRHLLNVESGVNDGLALPVVLIFLALAGRGGVNVTSLVGEVAGGITLGIALPAGALAIGRLRFFKSAPLYEPLTALAAGLILLSLSSLIGANVYLAAFAGGATIAAIEPSVRDAFHQLGDLLAELLKLAALLVFGALISPHLLVSQPIGVYLFAAAALFLVRPAALGVALVGEHLPRPVWLAAAWFGPKGFASVVYGLLILKAPIAHGTEMFQVVALVVAASVIAHSSTDVLVARWFDESEQDEAAEPEEIPEASAELSPH